MFEAVAQVIGRPTAFFMTLQESDRLAAKAVWVAVIVSLLAGVIGYFNAVPLAEAFAGTPLGGLSLISAPLFAAFISFLGWLIYGLIVRMTAGIDAKPWAIVGYSMAPQIIIYTLLIVIAALFPVQLSAVAVDFSDTESLQQTTQALQQEIQTSFFGRSSQVLGYAATLWWLCLIFLGARAATTTAKALSSALIVGLLSLGFILVPFLLAPL